MEMKELMKARAEQSLQHLLDKIDKVCDDARDEINKLQAELAETD